MLNKRSKTNGLNTLNMPSNKKIKPWKLISSEMPLDEKWYRVRKDTVEIRPGRVIDDYYVGLFNDIVMVAAITKDNQIVLVRQYKHGAGQILTELPAGYMENNEEPLAAAKRELQEETGFTSSNWRHLGYFIKNSAKSVGNNIHIFLAKDASQTHQQNLNPNEDIEVITIPFQEALQQALNQEIQGSDSVLSLLLVNRK
jgi:ADP-ribose pyrophosphatase